MFKASFIAYINFSIPIILIFYMFPALMFNNLADVMISIPMGIWIFYLHYMQLKTAQNSLLYVPSGRHKELFDSYIRLCNFDPSKVIIKYAYTGQQMGMAMGNTLIIDPTTCSICKDDVNANPVLNVFHQLYEANLDELGKRRQSLQLQNLTPEIQAFIFKHELGHIVGNYSYKELGVNFVIATLSFYGGISMAKFILSSFGILPAIFAGILAATFLDIFLTLFSNLLFKVRAEKRADYFAAKYSSKEEIIQAAHFFVEEQEIIDVYKNSNDWVLKLPIELYSGHPHAKSRKKYLLQLAEHTTNL
jgi:hypothetical protein